jgi:glycosyltransferase involved in cell wall biosynthesis
MIAFHYPPFQGSSGILRTWNFSRYLERFGWRPTVLTATTSAYESVQQEGEGALQIPAHVPVRRAFGLDTARHFALRGRYPGWLALPDRWISWYPAALVRALVTIMRERPAAIWSTFPIATTHLVAHAVHRLTGIPWIADFRDSMTEAEYPSDSRKRAVYQGIERKVVQAATALVFTTESTRRMYRERYPAIPAERFHVIANGYDEESFALAEQKAAKVPGRPPETITLLHSGILYPSERDPRPLFKALAALKSARQIHAGRVRIVLRASGHDALMSGMLQEYGIEDLVSLAPPVSYGAALTEMLSVDALLLMQAANSNHQIPAKLYEYCRTGKPILALTDSRGDSAAVLRAAGVDTIVDIADAAAIERQIPEFLARVQAGTAPTASREFITGCSRESQAGSLAQLLASVAG